MASGTKKGYKLGQDCIKIEVCKINAIPRSFIITWYNNLRLTMYEDAENKSSEPANSLLMIATDFPPMVGTNTQRIQSFARHMKEYGWQAHVLTHAINDLYLIDSKELLDIPDYVSVYRVESSDPFRRLRRYRKILPRDLAKNKQGSNSLNRHAVTENDSARLVSSLKKLISGFLLQLPWKFYRKFVYIPDAERLWSISAYRKALVLINEAKVTVVMTSSPAYSTHLAGLRLKRETGVFWIAEFRDLWVGRPGRPEGSAWRQHREEALEADVVRECDHITVASPAWIENFSSRYGEWVRGKMTCITNGYDGSQISATNVAKTGDEVMIVNTGAMYGSESPAPFLSALAKIKSETPEVLSQVRVMLAGYAGEEQPRLDMIVDSAGLTNIVNFPGILPHRDCLALQQHADILLLCNGPEHQQTIRGRSFEYMATGKPILAITPEKGEQAKLLIRAGSCLVVDYGDPDGIRTAIIRLLSLAKERKTAELKPDWEYIKQYERSKLTACLVKVIEDLQPQVDIK